VIGTAEDSRGYKLRKERQSWDAVWKVVNAAGINPYKTNLILTFTGDLVATSGVGASAAFCTSLARALNDEFNLELDNAGINKLAYEGEKAFHGKAPSGIDNTVSVYGGVIYYTKGNPPKIEHLALREPLGIVLGNTKITSSTDRVIGYVREFAEENPAEFKDICSRYLRLADAGKEALKDSDWRMLGNLMTANHLLLQQIGVSHERLDLLVEAAVSAGALGGHVAGSGRVRGG